MDGAKAVRLLLEPRTLATLGVAATALVAHLLRRRRRSCKHLMPRELSSCPWSVP